MILFFRENWKWILALVLATYLVFEVKDYFDENKLDKITFRLEKNQRLSDSLKADIEKQRNEYDSLIQELYVSIDQQQDEINDKQAKLYRYEKQIDNYNNANFDERFSKFSNLITKNDME